MTWVYLAIAITAEVIATAALKATDGFTRLGPTVVSLTGYVVAFYFLAIVLRTIPVGIAYAIWAGAGVALVALIGLVVYGQKLDLAAVVGITLIVAGVVVLNTLSDSVRH
ncbi:DMT family transporter [Palleronia sp. KMU-117]|uniref:DMT family transporter n=1 Tax=Palleronia sp. KMU-117 TaxID=3434108 RepID=UPI003D72B144